MRVNILGNAKMATSRHILKRKRPHFWLTCVRRLKNVVTFNKLLTQHITCVAEVIYTRDQFNKTLTSVIYNASTSAAIVFRFLSDSIPMATLQKFSSVCGVGYPNPDISDPRSSALSTGRSQGQLAAHIR